MVEITSIVVMCALVILLLVIVLQTLVNSLSSDGGFIVAQF
jgi:hypothetical protein